MRQDGTLFAVTNALKTAGLYKPANHLMKRASRYFDALSYIATFGAVAFNNYRLQHAGTAIEAGH